LLVVGRCGGWPAIAQLAGDDPMDVVELSIDGAIATVTLNRPDKMNALNLAMWRQLATAFEGVDRNHELRCVILRGSGGNFAAGADLAEFHEHRWSQAQAARYGDIMLRALFAIRDCRHPTIAAIEGNCIGGGLELAAMCDLRLATTQSRYGIPIQKIGVTMPYPELSALVALLGRPTMLELLLEGGVQDADWALAKGLVTRLCASADLDGAVAALAGKIAAGSPVSHRNHKMMTRRCQQPVALSQTEIDLSYAAAEADDYREGITAFLAKRRPVFTGK
jgi:enoyl-CoA hydratase/carnithine racemase